MLEGYGSAIFEHVAAEISRKYVNTEYVNVGHDRYPMHWQDRRKSLHNYKLMSEIVDIHNIHIRDHDFGRLHKTAKRM